MELNIQKEQFSKAYVSAVAAQAGCNMARPDIDDDSIDVLLMAKDLRGCVRTRAQIDIQLKCTASCSLDKHDISFALPLKNFNDLRVDVIVPRLLVVVCVPQDCDDWTVQSEHELILRHCAYWYSLFDVAETDNTSTVTVHIPKKNIFSVEFLKTAMHKVANGQRL